jgi:hypothetical protein
VQVVYDEPAILDDYEGVDIETLTRELSPKNPFALNLMRITVDGEPIDDPNRSWPTSKRLSLPCNDRRVSIIKAGHHLPVSTILQSRSSPDPWGEGAPSGSRGWRWCRLGRRL